MKIFAKKLPEFLIMIYLTSGGDEQHHCSSIVYVSLKTCMTEVLFPTGKNFGFCLAHIGVFG